MENHYIQARIRMRDLALDRACAFEQKARENPSIEGFYQAKIEECLVVAERCERQMIAALEKS